MSNSNFETKFEFEGGGGTVATTKTIKNYSQADIGDNPSINLATGRLRYSFADLNVGYGNFAIGISHVYVSDVYKSFADKFKHYGNNWKLNVSQCVIKEENNLLYMDAEGEIHRFVKFDGNRYYDERNAKTTLTSDTNGYEITDGVGNKWRFNAKGLLTEGISCHNAEIRKIYNYDALDRLISVYDKRTQINNVAKTRIELTYDGKGRLASMTSYVKFNKKASQLQYGYDSIGNLVYVRQSAFITTDKPCATKPTFKFSYLNSLLIMAEDCETKSAQTFAFDASKRLTKTTQGVVTYDGIALGAQDGASNTVELGAVECGTFDNRTFTPIKFNKYNYDFSLSDGISVQTDVTNENGITIAYFIDRNACITSSFEKMPDGKLKTLSKQGAKRTDKLTLNADGYINGKQSCTGSGEVSINLDNGFDVARNHAEKSYTTFSYSFWLKATQTYNVLEAELTCLFKDNSEFKNRIYVDSNAKNVWQKVSIPFSVQTDNDDKPITNNLKKLTIKFFANKSNSACTDSYQINEIGFSPSTITYFRFFSFQKSFYLTEVKNVTSGNNKYLVDKNMYFTENDVLSTLANKKANGDFDIICNNGTKRIANSQELSFSDGINYSETETNRLFISSYFPDEKSVTLIYVFGDDELFLEIIGDSKTWRSTSFAVSDYKNKVIKEESELSVTKEYEYDSYGRIKTVHTIGFNNDINSVTSYHYDDEGRLIETYDERDGQRINYTDYEQVLQITESRIANGKLTDTPHNSKNTYGIFQDKLTEVSDCDGEIQRYCNKITYDNGRLRTVTDGAAKYGVVFNPASSTVEYTQFDQNNTEQLVQQDKITSESINGVIPKQQHCSQFYEENEVKDALTTETDKYGKVTKITYQTGQEVANSYYNYDVSDESEFCAVPKKFTDTVNNVTKEFNYDADNNLVGWAEKENGKDVFKIQRIADGVTKTSFGIIPYAFSVSEFSERGFMSPQVVSTDFCLNRKDEINVGGLLRPFFNRYEYDGIGRIKRKYSEYNSGYTYIYGTGLKQKLLIGQDYNNYVDTKNPSSNGKDPDVTLSERLYPDYQKLKTVSTISYNDLRNSKNITKNNIELAHIYNFDAVHRLTKDSYTRTSNGAVTRLVRDYSYLPNGRLSEIKLTNGSTGVVIETKGFSYDAQGRLSHLSDGTRFYYDSYGNRTMRSRFSDSTSYEYKYGGNLHKVKRGSTVVGEYSYNENGVRLKKLANGKTTRYMLDGNKILGETTSDMSTYYTYDLNGLNGLVRIDNNANEEDYIYVRDTQNNVVMLTSVSKRMLARYEYDVFGNCTVYDESGRINTDPDFIGNINPFRWKSFYYDVESGLYYANGSYYDPQTGMYVDASPISTVIENAFTTHALDRNAPMCNNILELACMPYTIDVDTELHPDPTYQLQQDWLSKVIFKLSSMLNKLDTGERLLIASLLFVAALFIGYKLGGASLVCELISDVIISTGVGIVSYGAFSYLYYGRVTETGLTDAAVNSFLFASFFAFIYSSVNAVKYLYRSKAAIALANKKPPNNGAVPGTEKEITLQPGKYGRYGDISPYSDYITNAGASPSQLSLPPDNNGIYIEITVIKPIEKVEMAIVAPWKPWGGIGGGIQYHLPYSIQALRDMGYLIF